MVAERDVWWDQAVDTQASECEVEWLDGEDPLFKVKRKLACLTCHMKAQAKHIQRQKAHLHCQLKSPAFKSR